MLAREKSRFRRALDGAVSAAFLFAVTAPLLGTLLLPSSFDPSLENRLPAQVPALAWRTLASFPVALEKAFSDRFAFRGDLIHLTSRAKVALGVSPSPRVVIGRHGWLFYAGERAVDQYRRIVPFSKKELATFRDRLEARRAWLALRGCRYLFVVPPNKEVVYPDEMPSGFPRAARASRLDQLVAFLERHSAVEMLDLRKSLDVARRAERVYLRTDTHWNDLGAFAAYGQLAERVHDWFPGVVPLPRAATIARRGVAPGGDLAGMLSLREELPEGDLVSLGLRASRAKRSDPGVPIPPNNPDYSLPRAFAVDDPSLPTAVVFHDSFMNAPMPFLAEHFRRSVFLSTHAFPTDVLDRERPDLVIEETLERFLMMGPPENPPPLTVRGLDAPTGLPAGMDGGHGAGRLLREVLSFASHDLATENDGWARSTGDDPFLQGAVEPLTAAEDQVLWIRLTTSPGREGESSTKLAQLFWASEGHDFNERESLRFAIVVDGKEHEYRVAPSLSSRWRGTVTHLRLDFPDVEPGKRYRLGAITLTPEQRL